MNGKICQTLGDAFSARMRLFREECLLEKDRMFRAVLLLMIGFAGLLLALTSGLLLGFVLSEGDGRIIFLISSLVGLLLIGGLAFLAAARLIRKPVFSATAAELGKDRKCLESALGK